MSGTRGEGSLEATPLMNGKADEESHDCVMECDCLLGRVMRMMRDSRANRMSNRPPGEVPPSNGDK